MPAMATRSKQTISLDKLKEIGKVSLKEPSSTHYLNEDVAVVVSTSEAFFLALAPLTKRLNPSSLALMGKDLFQMSAREAQLFADSLAHAFSHCITAGGKAKTGAKLPREVQAVYVASLSCKDAAKKVKGEVKEEPSSSSCPAVAKLERDPSPPRPAKFLKKCLSSPTQIAALYAGSSASARVKVMHVCIYRTHKQIKKTHMCKST